MSTASLHDRLWHYWRDFHFSLQEKHPAANKPLCVAFVDLEKDFERVPRDVIWYLGIDDQGPELQCLLRVKEDLS